MLYLTPQELFKQAASDMEQALADALQNVVTNSTNPEEIAQILKLVIQKEIVLELLLEEILSVS